MYPEYFSARLDIVYPPCGPQENVTKVGLLVLSTLHTFKLLEFTMHNQKIIYEVKFPKVVIAPLAVIAFGLLSNVLIQTVQPAWASGSIHVYTVDGNPLLVKAVD